jgi:hypothetical protein
MAQMQTISIRIPDEDFQWLLSLPEAGAKTPSEKLRALLARVRQQETGMASHETCVALMRGLAQPLVEAVVTVERKEKVHSNLVASIAEWVPQIMATLISERPGDKAGIQEVTEIEAILAQECFRLFSGLLRAGITSLPATYDKSVLDKYLPDIIEIVSIISTRRTKEVHHG